jgi:hypothetical protein
MINRVVKMGNRVVKMGNRVHSYVGAHMLQGWLLLSGTSCASMCMHTPPLTNVFSLRFGAVVWESRGLG